MIAERLPVIKERLERSPHLDEKYARQVFGGIGYLQGGNPEIAERYFMHAVRIQPRDPVARELWGYSLLEQGGDWNVTQSIEIFGSVTYLEPNPDSYRNLAIALARFNKFHPYVALLKDALEHNPDDDLLIRIGRISVTQGMENLTDKIQRAMEERKLRVALTPL